MSGWTRSAISIQASGHVNSRINQAGHTEAPEPAHHHVSKIFLHPKGRPHTGVGKVRLPELTALTIFGPFGYCPGLPL